MPIDCLSTLAWLVDAGADEAVLDEPVDRFAGKTSRETAQLFPPPLVGGGEPRSGPGEGVLPQHPPPGSLRYSAKSRPPPQGGRENRNVSASVSSTDSIGSAMEIAAACNSLEELKAALERFDGCALKKTAAHTVFADGTPSHRIMFIGEAPGAEEDRLGKPFVGRAGQLLDRMLAAIDLDRRKNVYITNVLNWRPPGNRDPSPEEAAMCLPFLRRHIELVAPEVIVLLGGTAARHVLGRTDGIMRLRGHWLEYFAAGKMVPVMPTLHPAYLLRQPAHKKLAWHDFQAIDDRVKSLRLLEPAVST